MDKDEDTAAEPVGSTALVADTRPVSRRQDTGGTPNRTVIIAAVVVMLLGSLGLARWTRVR